MRTITSPGMGLEHELLAALRAVRFDEILDRGLGEARPAPVPAPIAHVPTVDLAVIDLDGGQAANVVLSPRHPDGLAVADGLPADFTTPYPASLFKLVVGFYVVALAQRGALDLDAEYAYEPAAAADEEPVTGGGPAIPGIATNRDWLDAMVTASNDRATCALLKQLHDLGEVEAMNAAMRALGFGTLQITGTSPRHGGRWRPGEIRMTAMETARLLERVAIEGGLLHDLLANQGCNEVLSTANWGLTSYPARGIPQRVPERWIDPADGTVTVDGKAFGRDVRPANARAEVTFAHKTGLTYNYASDAGIVRSLAGAPERHYVIACIADLGYRYTDGRDPQVRYTEKLARLGRLVDELLMAG